MGVTLLIHDNVVCGMLRYRINYTTAGGNMQASVYVLYCKNRFTSSSVLRVFLVDGINKDRSASRYLTVYYEKLTANN